MRFHSCFLRCFAVRSFPTAHMLSSVALSGNLPPPVYVQSQPQIHSAGNQPTLDPGLSQALSSPQSGSSLSMSLRPVPARVVGLILIQADRFVEMQDLLGDNVAMRDHLDDIRLTMGANLLQVSSRPRVREVTTLPSWICCFLTVLAVGTTDVVTRD